jgi:pyridoxine kinase
MKRVISIQDISCVGKCSLTVALPIISAMGAETAILPTAVLSNHTAFKSFTFHDLTSQIRPIAEQFKEHEFKFDAIYTGYLGSFEQIELVSDFFDGFKSNDNFIFVDPAMGDFGRLYSGFDRDFAKKMGQLCAKADIIVPNMTEAAFMLDIPYVESGYSVEYVKDVLKRLSQLGAEKAVLTGVTFEEDKIGVMGYDCVKNEYFSYFNRKIDAVYHGTGDIFASTCVGALTRGMELDSSLKLAADFTAESIKKTVEDSSANWYGVNFEQAIPFLIQNMQ